jgi:type II secretory pathway pseudopilin PulG
MIIVAILLIIVAILTPKFAKMIQTANEASTVGKLVSMRGALSVYYTDNEGFYPADLTPLLTPGSKYLTGIIPMYTQQHGSNEQISFFDANSTPTDTGGWGYVNNHSQPSWGYVFVDCTHTDLKGYVWTSY